MIRERIHLMPFLDVTKGKSDGGYAVSDFRKVREDLPWKICPASRKNAMKRA